MPLHDLRLMLHNRQKPLRRPMHQILRTRITKTFVSLPVRRPNQVERSIFPPRNRRIAHELAAYFGFEVITAQVCPTIAVVTVSQMQAVRSRLAEGGEEVGLLFAG